MSDHAGTARSAVTGHGSEAGDRTEQRLADRRRAAKLRERREQAGQVRIQVWVPQERAAYARQVLHATAAGANALPPDPEHQVALDAAKAEAAAVRAELKAARDAGRRADQARAAESNAALVRAEAAERGREEAARELAAARAEVEAAQGRERAAQEAANTFRGELVGIKGRGGWRGVLLRLAGVGGRSDPLPPGQSAAPG